MSSESTLISLMILFFLGLRFINSSSTQFTDTLRMGQSINTSERIVSAGGTFELGFFPTEKNTKFHVGIWFRKVPKDHVVWVANREYAFHSSAVLTINSEGNLVISDGKLVYFLTNTSGGSSTSATLFDSGNLVQSNDSSLEVLWQSFNYPTDILLPGMRIGLDPSTGYSWSLTSWRSADDPAPGLFSLQVDRVQRVVITKGSNLYWTDIEDKFLIQTSSSRTNGIWNKGYFTLTADSNGSISRIVLEVSGELNEQIWSEDAKGWLSLQSSVCGTNALCGSFGICNPQSRNPCGCLKGFKSYNNANSSMKGCDRQTALLCSNGSHAEGEKDGFLFMSKVGLPSNPLLLDTGSAVGCESACWSNCSCVAYTYDRTCFLWNDEVINLKNLSDSKNDTNIGGLYLKLAASELVDKEAGLRNGTQVTHTSRNRQLLTILVASTLTALLLLFLSVCFYTRRKLARKGEDLLQFDLGMGLKVKNLEGTEVAKLERVTKREVKLPLFSFTSVCSATDNFSASNKLGEGGFGPVYRGKLLTGDEVAVKRLSRRSGQGWEELKNEALLIAKLQHNNLVRLLGCCIEGDEKILIYEFMPNKSLDFFIFDSTKRRTLDWGTRVQIIDGIAQGLLYLHQYSRLRIIHRDLKASNILLDINMNPKISDFGMARIFGGNELQANTNRIVGTYGYMSPEYALEGLFSIKSDVFSFGVLLLEIVSGKKNTGFYQTGSLNLVGYAWDFWTSGRGMDLMDPVLEEDSSKHKVIRYVNIGLLCVQESAADRPTMSDILTMLGNDSTVLPYPKQPAFLSLRKMVNDGQAERITENCSVNNMTASIMEAD
ncbi:Receptor-like kinase [Quillaja saponaria]|uniref:Receptor-like serine/threonine-protein kinase n=1 Tax=Quillaja saponaria TaxID=32244 RepID=A0AAD7PBD1_QUISA|nr:Receptor-like kinase [Quillaja saponaria]